MGRTVIKSVARGGTAQLQGSTPKVKFPLGVDESLPMRLRVGDRARGPRESRSKWGGADVQ